MQTINIHEAKTHLSRLLEQVAEGEEIIIAKADKAIAHLVPLDAPPKKRQQHSYPIRNWCGSLAKEALIYSSHRRKPVSSCLISLDSSLRRNDGGGVNQRFPKLFLCICMVLAVRPWVG